MTPTERAKRSDALYYETVSVNRRVLCDMVANREADLEDARESVKRLMTQRDERLAKAETDNAELRELVKALLTCATDGDCDECRLNGATPWHVGKAQLCDGVWDRVRELGVEADE